MINAIRLLSALLGSSSMINAIRFVVAFVVMLLACSLASAQTQTKVWHESYQPTYYPSADAACRAIQTNYEPTASSDGMSSTCMFYQMVGTEKRVYSGKVVVAEYRTCTPPLVPTFPSGACGTPPPPPCTAGSPYTFTYSTGPMSLPPSLPKCDGSCAVQMTEIIECFSLPESSTPNIGYCTVKVQKTGAQCTASDVPPATTPPTTGSKDEAVPPFQASDGKCPIGTTQAGVDSSGTPICMGSGTAPKSPEAPPPVTTEPPVTVTNPDGSTTVTETAKKTNSDGSVTTTTTTTTTGVDGSVSKNTTVVVGNTPLGEKGRDTPDPSDEKYDLCKQHPDLNVCRNSTVTGSCEAIACTGDAIQCATLREAAQIQCRQKRAEDELKESSLFAAGSAAVAGTDMEGLPTPANAAQFDVQTQLDQAGFLGGGACFTDKTVTIQGHTITLPFSAACDYLIVFRYVVMIIAGFVSFRLLSTATLKD